MRVWTMSDVRAVLRSIGRQKTLDERVRQKMERKFRLRRLQRRGRLFLVPRRDGLSAWGRKACGSPLPSIATFMRP